MSGAVSDVTRVQLAPNKIKGASYHAKHHYARVRKCERATFASLWVLAVESANGYLAVKMLPKRKTICQMPDFVAMKDPEGTLAITRTINLDVVFIYLMSPALVRP